MIENSALNLNAFILKAFYQNNYIAHSPQAKTCVGKIGFQIDAEDWGVKTAERWQKKGGLAVREWLPQDAVLGPTENDQLRIAYQRHDT